MVENDEPAAWAEELIEPARAVDHPRLAALYVMASQCYTTGRIDEAVQYCDAGQIVLARSRDTLSYGLEGMLGGAYLFSGQAERWVEVCRAGSNAAATPMSTSRHAWLGRSCSPVRVRKR